MDNFKVENVGKWRSGIMYDADEKLYTIFYIGSGGAIISDEHEMVAKHKFINAMDLAEAIKRITHKL